MISSEEVSRLRTASSPSSKARCNIAGTTTAVSTRSAARLSSQSSALKRRRVTTRQPSEIVGTSVAKPSEWKKGGAM